MAFWLKLPETQFRSEVSYLIVAPDPKGALFRHRVRFLILCDLVITIVGNAVIYLVHRGDISELVLREAQMLNFAALALFFILLVVALSRSRGVKAKPEGFALHIVPPLNF